MTGFASARGAFDGYSWAWDMRSVNARGLDIRLRLPDWIEGLDASMRKLVGQSVARGNVTVGLRVSRDTEAATEAIDHEALARVLSNLAQVEKSATDAGLALEKTNAAQVLSLRGVLTSDVSDDADTQALAKAILATAPDLIDAFVTMRRTEGQSLAEVIGDQLDQIEELTGEAATLAEARKDQTAARLRENLARVMDNTDGADEARVAQELAFIAVKTDVTEEIDRLGAHISAARELLADSKPNGRKLDFLCQEFNREANTLCSKAQASDLTRVGLDLKATIDQMREQVQNVE